MKYNSWVGISKKSAVLKNELESMNYKIGLLLISIIFNFTISYAQYDSIPYGGYDRTYNLHLPTGYTGSTSIPLIIALHGGGHSAIEIESMSGLSLKADLENFIVVYPEGVKGPLSNARTWNAGECCGYASFANIDDVGFIDALITILTSQYNIDTTRIHATGVSNGGFFAYRLACELSNKIASIAPVASSMTLDYCTPDRPVSIHQRQWLGSSRQLAKSWRHGFHRPRNRMHLVRSPVL
jgi:polyhydroxybutyrate depolymerase